MTLKKTVLIIQEDVVILKILQRIMELHEYECRAIRGLQELDIEDQMIGFDIILSDILFEGIAPLDFVFQIQEIIIHRSLVIVTKMGQQKVRDEILSSKNVDGFFSVPFDMDEVEKLIA